MQLRCVAESSAKIRGPPFLLLVVHSLPVLSSFVLSSCLVRARATCARTVLRCNQAHFTPIGHNNTRARGAGK